jgi:hypothetical protein
MNGRLRDAFGGGTSLDAAVGRGMADVLTALGNVIDDDVALRHVCGRTAAVPGQVAGTVRAPGPAPSRRWLAVGAVAGVAAALTAGAVTLATIDVRNLTAYVVKRVDSALGAANPGGIAQMTVTFHGPAASGGAGVPATAQEWSYGGRWRAITYTAAGQRLYDEGFGAAAAQTVVSYPARSWARQPGPGPADLAPGLRGCAPLIAAVPLLLQAGLPGSLGTRSPASVATNLRRAISCGTLTEAGRQRVDGIDAIKLTSRPGSLISETVWVSPGTYLPVRLVIRGPGEPASRQTADISWLAPTAQNLARLTVPIPAGFREVPLTQIIKPAMVRIPA